LARKAYRKDENDIKGPITDAEAAGFGPEDVIVNNGLRQNGTNTIQDVSVASFKDISGHEYHSYDNPGAEFNESSNETNDTETERSDPVDLKDIVT
jgi:hypothetical protein